VLTREAKRERQEKKGREEQAKKWEEESEVSTPRPVQHRLQMYVQVCFGVMRMCVRECAREGKFV
jgi:hypothetical protein